MARERLTPIPLRDDGEHPLIGPPHNPRHDDIDCVVKIVITLVLFGGLYLLIVNFGLGV